MNQSGSGAAHYSLTKTSRRHTEKFETTGVDYLLKVNNLNVRGLSHVLKTLDGLLTSILSDMTAGIADRDQIRFVMHSPQLNNPISLPFMPLKELTPRRLMFEIERVLQSHEEFVLGDDIHINLIHVKMPSGSGNENRKRCGVNLKTRNSRKRCVVDIKNKDELCAARAIVTAIAKLEGFPNYRSYIGWTLRSTDHGVGSPSQCGCTADTVWYRENEVVSGCVTRVSTGRGQWGPF